MGKTGTAQGIEDGAGHFAALVVIEIHLFRQVSRGDVVTFSSPTDGTRLIKRVMALPGDVVEMRDETLIINGQAATYTEVDQVMEPIGQGRFTPARRFDEKVGSRQQRIQLLPQIAARRHLYFAR